MGFVSFYKFRLQEINMGYICRNKPLGQPPGAQAAPYAQAPPNRGPPHNHPDNQGVVIVERPICVLVSIVPFSDLTIVIGYSQQEQIINDTPYKNQSHTAFNQQSNSILAFFLSKIKAQLVV